MSSIKHEFLLATLACGLALGCTQNDLEWQNPSDPETELYQSFPDQAADILERGAFLGAADQADGGRWFHRVLGGELDLTRGTLLQAGFPARASEPVVFALPDGFRVLVHEQGLTGPARRAGSAITYGRGDQGYSYWSATDDGYEEWLLVHRVGSRLAEMSWVVEGAMLREVEGAVELVDATGRARIRVTAPETVLENGERAENQLTVQDNRLILKPSLPHSYQGAALIDPVWQVTDDSLDGHYLHSATRLDNGQVLIAGGIDFVGSSTANAEIYDPATGSWTATGSLNSPVRSHAAVLLNDGRVLLSYGLGGSLPIGTYAEIYDPTTGSWTVADPSRSLIGGPLTMLGEKSVLLPNGQVLLSGGFCCPSTQAQIYDPGLDQFIPIAPMLFTQIQHTLTLLPDGTVLSAGGGTTPPSGAPNSHRAQLFIPDTSSGPPDYVNGHWQEVANMNIGHFDHSAALLTVGPNAGKVLVCAGVDGQTMTFTRVCELYDPTTASFSLTGSTMGWRQLGGTGNNGNAMARVQGGDLDGHVVFAGGYPSTSMVEIYDPFTGTWSRLCDINPPRLRHTVTPMGSGELLMAGGQSSPFGGVFGLRAAQVFRPSLDDSDCDTIIDAFDDCTAGVCGTVSGTLYADREPTENCAADVGDPGVANRMIRAQQGSDRFYTFTDSLGTYQLTLPAGLWTLSLVPHSTTTASPACDQPQEHLVWVSSGSSTPGNDFFARSVCSGEVTLTGSGVPQSPNPCGGVLPGAYVSPCPGSQWQFCATFSNTGSENIVDPTMFHINLGPGFLGSGMMGIDSISSGCYTGSPGFNGNPTTNPEFTWSLGPGASGAFLPNEQCTICMTVDVISIPPGGWTSSAFFDQGTCETGAAVVASDTLQYTQACSCDPNQKLVSPVGCGEQGFIHPQTLSYHIDFQNIGSGAAHDVVIRDLIDPDLDIETLRFEGSSHPVSDIRIEPGGELVVRFTGIELPPEAQDHEASKGFIDFRIDPLASAADGDVYENRAAIYFDQNVPVITNTVTNTIGECPDTDGDDVADDTDLCPDTPANVPVDASGCSGLQYVALTCPGPAAFPTHGQYVSCVAHATAEAVAAGIMTQEERKALIRAAAQSH